MIKLSTSFRSDSSPAQAAARKADRSPGSRSSADCRSVLMRCQRSGFIDGIVRQTSVCRLTHSLGPYYSHNKLTFTPTFSTAVATNKLEVCRTIACNAQASWRLLFGQFVIQPGFGRAPLAFDRGRRETKNHGSLPDGQAAEES